MSGIKKRRKYKRRRNSRYTLPAFMWRLSGKLILLTGPLGLLFATSERDGESELYLYFLSLFESAKVKEEKVHFHTFRFFFFSIIIIIIMVVIIIIGGSLIFADSGRYREFAHLPHSNFKSNLCNNINNNERASEKRFSCRVGEEYCDLRKRRDRFDDGTKRNDTSWPNVGSITHSLIHWLAIIERERERAKQADRARSWNE